MAIGTVTHVAAWGESPLDPTFVDVVSFPGPAAVGTGGGYTTGGDTGLLEALETAVGQNRTILAALCINGGGYHAEYVQSTDKVKVYGTGSAEYGAGSEVEANTALNGTTFHFLVISK